MDKFENILKNLPHLPGCYIYKDSTGKVIYVGKAKDLKRRVYQYFQPRLDLSIRIEQMITKIHEIEYHVVDTETEALILETNLIKKYRPKYNVLMKDDKTYTWIKITVKEDFPRILRVRDKDKSKQDDGSIYFGPYPNTLAINSILRFLRKIFPYRTCNYDIRKEDTVKKSRTCLYYHVELCPGPCDNLIEQVEYMKTIKNIIRFLRGDNKKIIQEYKEKMIEYSGNLEFEKAQLLRDKINDIKYVTQKILLDSETDENKLEVEKKQRIENGLIELFEKTNSINKNNFRMECYDISNIQGTNPVSSMVVFENGIPKKSDYRKFKINSLNTPNDFAMMNETISRRLQYIVNQDKKRQDKSFNSIPDLMIIDGGKGQLKIAYDVIKNHNLNINVIGLAKRDELIFFPNSRVPLKLGRESNSLYLIQRIRDEAHRFAITFHRNLRSKNALLSFLDQINGIGPITKAKLLKRYQTIDKIITAPREDLKEIVKNENIINKIVNPEE